MSDSLLSDWIDQGLLTEPTRRALEGRVDLPSSGQPQYFSPSEMNILEAVCDRILCPPPEVPPFALAVAIDERLAGEKGDGWRYAEMPPDGEAYRLALQALESANFLHLPPLAQDELLRQVQRGEVQGEHWARLSPPRFFEELLAEVVECYYSLPAVSVEIGYAGMADARGWSLVGLNEKESWEPPIPGNLHL